MDGFSQIQPYFILMSVYVLGWMHIDSYTLRRDYRVHQLPDYGPFFWRLLQERRGGGGYYESIIVVVNNCNHVFYYPASSFPTFTSSKGGQKRYFIDTILTAQFMIYGPPLFHLDLPSFNVLIPSVLSVLIETLQDPLPVWAAYSSMLF